MSLVADASVAAKWFIKEADREKALRVLDTTERHAPDLIVPELGNVVWKKVVRGEMTAEQGRLICGAIRSYFHLLHPSERLIERAIDLALTLKHPIYDCLYLSCAEQVGARLVTADRRLLAAGRDHALAALVVHLDDVAW